MLGGSDALPLLDVSLPKLGRRPAWRPFFLRVKTVDLHGSGAAPVPGRLWPVGGSGGEQGGNAVATAG